jgi:hypothetical protein
MRAPGEKFSGHYSASQWNAIAKAIHRGLGLDADRTTVPGFQAGSDPHIEIRYPVDVAPPPGITLDCTMMLRTAVQRIVWSALRRPTSPPWLAAKAALHELKNQTDALRQAFIHCPCPQVLWFAEAKEAPAVLEKLSRRLAEELEGFPTRKAARINRYDARRSHLMLGLLRLWLDDLGGQPMGKATQTFLQACVEPALGPTANKSIARWLERYNAGTIHFHY